MKKKNAWSIRSIIPPSQDAFHALIVCIYVIWDNIP